MKRLIILRHGETEWNREEKFRGMADLPLTENGLQQAGHAARRIAELKPTVIYSSPLRRALQTAEAVGKAAGLPVHREEGLKDIDYGTWQGLSLPEAYNKYRKAYLQWLHSPQLVEFPRGESLPIVQDRVKKLLKFIDENHKDDAILFVTHKVVCKVLVLTLLGADLSHFWQIKQDVAAINVFDKRNVFLMAWAINETCHLKRLKDLKIKN